MRSDIEKSVVRINVSAVSLKYSEPWSTRKTFNGSGTGFAIKIKSKSYILTNAHVVDMAVKITVFVNGKLHPAKLHSISYECDLAILAPLQDNAEWLNSMNFLEFGDMPNKGEKMYVYGYPYGGDNASVTKGVISRIDTINYSNFVDRIAIQVDAAVNPGNSGGPAVNKNGNVIGVVFSGIDNADNMGYAIPVVIVKYFISYIERHGQFMGLSDLGISYQNLENTDLRHYLGLPASKSGILITDSSNSLLKPQDILVGINGKMLDYSGNMKMHDIISDYSVHEVNEELASFDNYIGLILPGDKIQLEIFRAGKLTNLAITAEVRKTVVPLYPTDVSKKYVILGGLVFVVLSHAFIMEKAKKGISLNANLTPGKQHIVLSKILQSEYTHGYEYDMLIVGSINGKQIKSIDDVINVMLSARKKHKSVVIEYINSNMIHVISADGNSEKNNKEVIEANIGTISES